MSAAMHSDKLGRGVRSHFRNLISHTLS